MEPEDLEEATESAKSIRALRREILGVLRRHLEVGPPRAQINRAELLLAANDEAGAESAYELLIAHLAADGQRWNGNLAFGALSSLHYSGAEAPRSMMEAGLAIAVEDGDLEMTEWLVRGMSDWIEDWTPGDNAPLLRLMMDNLRHDDVPGNAAAVYGLLYPHRERLAPMLQEIAADESGDWQVRRAATRLLAGEYYLGEPEWETGEEMLPLPYVAVTSNQ